MIKPERRSVAFLDEKTRKGDEVLSDTSALVSD